MTDPRMLKLADLLVNYSCALKKGENILIEAIDIPYDFTKCLVGAVDKAGGRAFVSLKSNEINRALMQAGSEESWKLTADIERKLMEKVQCYLGVRGNSNISELSDVPGDKQKL